MLRINKTILVVDDDEGMLGMITRQLRKKYHLYTSESGQQAMKMLKNKDIDLVLLDQMMPKMTGIETFEEIKEFNSFSTCNFFNFSEHNSLAKYLELPKLFFIQ